jgi:hypothetical protein
MTDVLSRTTAAPAVRPQPSRRGPERRPIDPTIGVRATLAALSGAAGAIHLAMVPSHWSESAVEGVGFAVTGWFQLALAFLLLWRPTTLLLKAAVVANMAFIGVWAVSRTYGLPFGPEAWHPHDPGFVDLVTVGAEGALVLLAAGLLLRPGLGRGWSRSRLAFSMIIPVAVIALATAALASPSARDHASGSHAHGGEAAAAGGHAHGDAATGDDKGLSLLQNGHQHGGGEVPLDNATRAALTSQLAETSKLMVKYPNIAAAEAAGYTRAGPFSPGLGTHYIGIGATGAGEDVLMGVDGPMSPTLIYDGLEQDSPLAGFMYQAYGAKKGGPEGFVGPNDHWHYHTNTCIVFKDGRIEAPLGADAENVTQKMCDRYGGRLIENTGYMVHVWTVPGYESPRGVFSEINPNIACPDGSYYVIPLQKLGYRTSACRNTEA